MTMIDKCKNWIKYKAVHTPKCNKGKQCQYCTALWQYRLDKGGKPLTDRQRWMFGALWFSEADKEILREEANKMWYGEKK